MLAADPLRTPHAMKRDAVGTSQTITLEPTLQPDLVAASARLCVVHPPELAAVVPIPRAGLVLGRRPPHEAGLLAHGTISRQHLRVAWDGRTRAHIATELGSHNGTWVDGEALPANASVPLGAGAVLRLGGVIAIYEPPALGDDAAGAALADVIPGLSRAVSSLRARIAEAGPDPSPALIIGDTGAGKEHVARALHDLSGRRGPLLAINVSELSPQLVESQLFGHLKGAFTGADRPHDGLFRGADGGTLFLDEIGELPLELQPKLLRVLQESEVRPVGATRGHRIDVRVVAATNRDLVRAVDAGTFRRDLYARLALWEVPVPSLAERRADVMLWIGRLCARWAADRGRPAVPLAFDVEAVEALVRAPWPENLRGIDRLVHRLASRKTPGPVTVAEVRGLLGVATPDPIGVASRGEDDGAPAPDAVRLPPPATREELAAVVASYDGNINAIARHYGRDRRQVYRWLDAFDLPRGSR